MFNLQNKKKLDSRVRFQNRNFQSKLNKQRKYKRGPKTIPQNGWEFFLSKVGLDKIRTRIIVTILLAILIYTVYIPNPLYIKTVQINGITQPKRGEIQKVVESYLNKTLPLPQKNLVLLSQSKLKNYLLANNQSILEIKQITKVYPNNLIINILPRQDTFIIESKNGYFAATNDGFVSKIYSDNFSSTSTLPSDLILIKLKNEQTLFVGQQALSPESANFLKTFYDNSQSNIKSTLSHFEMISLEEPDITARSNNKFNILFSLKTDFEQINNRLQLLFSQLSPQEIQDLEYIDMRFEDRGYVCKKFQPCVKDIQLPNAKTATSTEESLIN